MATSEKQARVYLAKLTYGYSIGDLENFVQSGVKKWLDKQLDKKYVALSLAAVDVSAYRTPTMSIGEIYDDRVFKNRPQLVSTELAHITILRRLFSAAQLNEMLVEFLSDYVPIPLRTDRELWRFDYDQRVIRANALGYFPALLKSATVHPAMLNFLNGETNTKQNANENFGRELLELFTITPAAKYTETDVKQAAKLLTGLVWDYNNNKPGVNLDDHHFGQIRVFGYVDKNASTSSEQVVLKRIYNLVTHLALLPQTASAFSKRMAERFVSDRPTAALIKAMATSYTESKGHIPTVVMAMVQHPDFVKSSGSKVKRPMEHLASTVRALELKLSAEIPAVNPVTPPQYFKGSPVLGLASFLDTQGHLPFNWPFPDGYPDDSESWITLASQVQRWNLGTKLALGRMNASLADPEIENLLAATSTTVGEIVDDLSLRFFGKRLDSAERTEMVDLISDATKNIPNRDKQRNLVATNAAALLISKPEWNLR